MRSKSEKSLEGWVDKRKHHSGAVICLAIAPNSRILATGSNDNTCKIWSIVSYSKTFQNIETELNDCIKAEEFIKRKIDILDESYDDQFKKDVEMNALKIGEMPLPSGYHADLMFTYRHEATVLAVTFTAASE